MSHKKEKKEIQIPILFIGGEAAGQESILEWYKEKYSASYDIKFEFDDGKEGKLDLSVETFNDMYTQSTYDLLENDYDNIIFVVDITNSTSFYAVQDMIKDLKNDQNIFDKKKMVIFGHRLDKSKEKVNTFKEVEEYAEENGIKYFTTNLENGKNMIDGLSYIANLAYEKINSQKNEEEKESEDDEESEEDEESKEDEKSEEEESKEEKSEEEEKEEEGKTEIHKLKMTRKNKDNVRTYTPYSNVDVTIEKDENVKNDEGFGSIRVGYNDDDDRVPESDKFALIPEENVEYEDTNKDLGKDKNRENDSKSSDSSDNGDNNKNIGEVRMEYFDEDNRNIATKKEEELLIKPKKEKGGLFACC